MAQRLPGDRAASRIKVGLWNLAIDARKALFSLPSPPSLPQTPLRHGDLLSSPETGSKANTTKDTGETTERRIEVEARNNFVGIVVVVVVVVIKKRKFEGVVVVIVVVVVSADGAEGVLANGHDPVDPGIDQARINGGINGGSAAADRVLG
ncbi:hypothetical protein BO99DRAFT_181604 [Aspergillus violaceofuscus CBS 115571]|uniref:Uncharacterized protein n=1 Tax=Aspergillus violaceofuscus (strain CBS 115571) TaxID=1450538 RepID=A0A2V5I4W6_ASPV1|nr:hypothetical protein BO99DRAFT_181604 [Aspergillus violaceofuscus CBS 115571]